MQFYLSKNENLINCSTQKLRTAVPVLIAVTVLSTVAFALEYISTGYYLATGSSCVILMAVLFWLSKTSENKILLKVEDTYIEYLREDIDEMVQIGANDIEKVCTRFCEIQVYTRDHTVHRIDMSAIRKEQTRWEVKEMIKSLARLNAFSTIA